MDDLFVENNETITQELVPVPVDAKVVLVEGNDFTTITIIDQDCKLIVELL